MGLDPWSWSWRKNEARLRRRGSLDSARALVPLGPAGLPPVSGPRTPVWVGEGNGEVQYIIIQCVFIIDEMKGYFNRDGNINMQECLSYCGMLLTPCRSCVAVGSDQVKGL